MSGAKSGGFTITFKAVDGATTTIQSINKQLAQLTRPIKQFDAANKAFGGVQGLNSMTSSMRSLSVETLDVFRSMDRVVPVLGLITGAGSIAGMAAFAKSWSNTGFEIDQASKKIGIAATTLNSLQTAGRLAGISTEAMTGALGDLATHMRDALGGRDSGAMLMMNQLFGKDAQAEMQKTADQLLPDIADKIKAIRNPQDQMRAANAFGLGPLFPLLIQGGDAVRKYRAQGDQLNPMTQKQIDDADALAGSFREVEEAVRGETTALGDQFTFMTPYLEKLAIWISKNHELVTSISDIGVAIVALGALRFAPWVARVLGLGAGAGTAATIGLPLALSGDTAASPGAYDPVARPNLFDPYGAGGLWWSTHFGSGLPQRPLAGPRANPGAQQPAAPYTPGGILGDIGITGGQYDTYRSAVAGIEHARYNQMGGAGNRYAGRYQMGPNEIAETARRLFEPVPTQKQFLNDPAMQERYFEAYTDAHNQELMRRSEEYRRMTPQQRLAVLGYAHNQGVGGALEWMRTGQAGRDAFGTPGTAYSNAVAAGLATSNQTTAPNGVPQIGPVFGTQSGHVQVDVHIKGPAGTTASSTATGPVSASPPKVETPMAAYGGAP